MSVVAVVVISGSGVASALVVVASVLSPASGVVADMSSVVGATELPASVDCVVVDVVGWLSVVGVVVAVVVAVVVDVVGWLSVVVAVVVDVVVPSNLSVEWSALRVGRPVVMLGCSAVVVGCAVVTSTPVTRLVAGLK